MRRPINGWGERACIDAPPVTLRCEAIDFAHGQIQVSRAKNWLYGLHPFGSRIRTSPGLAHHGPRSMHDLAAQIVVGSSANAAKPRLAAGCILAGHQANPGSKIASGAKLPPISDCGDQCCGRNRSNPGHPHNAAARFVLAADCSKACIDLANSTIYFAELVD